MSKPPFSTPNNRSMTFAVRQLPLQWMTRLAALRLKAHWRSLSTAILGILLVAVIGASIPLYTAAIAQVGMIQHLHQQPVQDVSLYLQTSQSAAQAGDLDGTWAAHDHDLKQLIEATFKDDLATWIQPYVVTGETTPMQVVVDGEDHAARLRIAYYEGWENRFQLMEGSWPGPPTDPAAALEGAIASQAAERLGLNVGDELILEQRGWQSSVPLRVRITAVVRAANGPTTSADVQYGLRIGSSHDSALETNLFTTRAGFLQAAAQHVPDAGSTLGWWLSFDHEALSFADVDRAIAAIDDLQQALPATPRFIFRTQITAVLNDYLDEVDLLGAPFGLLLIQIGALALFFLIVTAALVRRAERREIAMLQSRGGANWQIALLDSVQMLLIGLMAIGIAPFVARRFLGWIVPFLTGIEHLPLTLDSRVFAYAGAAVGVSLLVLAMSLLPFLRLPLITAGGAAARSEKRLWWQRYYLDVVFLVVGIAASWRLVSQGTPLMQTQGGGLKADPLLLLAPLFLAGAAGSMVLRLFPVLSGWAARLVGRWGRLESALAMWQVSRESAHYGRLSFLLALAIGVGWLATSFHATLLRSQHDQAAYQVGADIRLQERDMLLKAERARPLSYYRNLPQVEAVTQTSRFFLANASGAPQQPMPGEILAVDPATFTQASYWRADLGSHQLPSGYAEFSDPGQVLPLVPARIGVWLRMDQPARDQNAEPVITEMGETVFEPNPEQLANLLNISFRLRDANGLRLDLDLEPQNSPADSSGWQYFEGDLAALPYALEGDIRLEMVHWHNVQYWEISRGRTFRLNLARLTLIGTDQSETVLDWLETDERWEFVENYNDQLGGVVARVTVPGEPDHPVVTSATWTQANNSIYAALVLNYPDHGAIPVIASPQTAALNGLLPGTTFQVGMVARSNPWFRLVATAEYFPTLYPDSKLFLIADQRSLLYALNRRPGPAVHPSEVWLRLRPGQSAESFLGTLAAQPDHSVVLSAQTIQRVKEHLDADMLQSGLIGLLYLAFAVAMILSVISLISYMALTVRQRQTDFGVLQAIGLSVRRLVTSIMLEQIIVMAVGVTLGVLLGTVMSDRVLPALAFSTSGETITPPFIIRVEAAALVQYGAFLLAVLGLTLAFSLILIHRLSLAELLRFGEE